MDLSAAMERSLTEERFLRATDRVVLNQGYGDTHGAVAITEHCIPRAVEAFTAACRERHHSQSHEFQAATKIGPIDATVLALTTLNAMLHGIGKQDGAISLFTKVGKAIQVELWAKAFRDYDASAAERAEKWARREHANREHRMRAVKTHARKNGFTLNPWNRDTLLSVGAWAVNVVLAALPDVFVIIEERDGTFISISLDAEQVALEAIDALIRRNPVFLPHTEPPVPWTGWNAGGPPTGRMRGSLVRARRADQRARVSAAIASGAMQPALDALNTIQSTPWRINRRVLSVVQTCVAEDIRVVGVPQRDPIAKPPHKSWDDMNEEERKRWRIKARRVANANRGLLSDRILLQMDMTTAAMLADEDVFFTSCNFDWRGRVYALPPFNFQRMDRVRALFEFACGEPIGEEGLWWLKVHTANCGDFGKVSKAAFSDRVQWVEDHLLALREIAKEPLSPTSLKFWTQADKPFLFLAAVFELVSALDEGPGFITHLPCSWDGSCSGLQHLCAMTLAEEGALVNLTPADKPQDVYQSVAEQVAEQVKRDLQLQEEDVRTHANSFIAFGIDRKLVKRNVMTYAYSSGPFGMAEQHREDLMKPLKLDVVLGLRKDHPFGEDDGFAAAKYIAGRTHAAIEKTVRRPAAAMAFLQRLARVSAHEGKPLSWITPCGLPWENRYHVSSTKRVKLYLHDRGVKTVYRPVVADGDKKQIDKNKSARAVAPNFVHACDAAHMLLTVNAAKSAGIDSFALVHDSFGCLANRSQTMHRVVREQFVKMYEDHDVLNEVLATTAARLEPASVAKLPEAPKKGTLNLKEVLNALYAFA